MSINKKLLTTTEVSELLDVRPARILAAIWNRRFKRPEKDPMGRYFWRQDEIVAAARVLIGERAAMGIARRLSESHSQTTAAVGGR
jgi:hypothetical protein